MNNFESIIVSSLLKKYYKRIAKYKDNKINQRINLPINKVLKNYDKYNVDIIKKELVDKAVENLLEHNFINVSKVLHSNDFDKIYLIDDNIDLLEKYAQDYLSITPRTLVIEDIKKIIKKYSNKGLINQYYIETIENDINNKAIVLDALKVEDLIKLINFIENNDKFLYIREVSMLVYGNSKYLEDNYKICINKLLFEYFISNGQLVDSNENLLERFNIYDSEQEICIKGDYTIVLNNKTIDINDLKGGVSFSIKDINQIQEIQAHCKRIMTIENKTSFLRMNDNYCFIFLSGFVSKQQISFIRKLISNNVDKEYYHFGDIDAGGFLIHKKLCEQTNKEFKLFHMSKDDLLNPSYKSCLTLLTTNDRNRLMNLSSDKRYQECIEFMLEKNIKLEQEIISLNISEGLDKWMIKM